MKIRYALIPQMKDYDRLSQQWSPYLMFFHAPYHASEVLSTDAYGFRITHKDTDKLSNFENIHEKPVGLVVGGSFVFGVGASTDRQTISSLMNENTDYVWLNFGGRAFSSTQELLLFQFFHQQVKGIKKIIILSGINNLVLNYMAQQPHELGLFFYQNQFLVKMNASLSKKRRLAKLILYPFFGERIDYAHIPFRELLDSVLFAKKRQAKPSSRRENKPISNKQNTDEADKENILKIIKRDIINWKLLTKTLGIELHYVLQPFSTWVEKEKSDEELKLFAELDQFQGRDWKILKDKLDLPLYDWFSSQLKEICNLQGVNFFDLNRELSAMRLDRKWLFVDRVHCTDEGNRIVASILKEKVLKI